MKIIRLIFAIPLAILASIIIPSINRYILKYFIPWDFANQIIDNYFIPFVAGSVTIGAAYLIAPRFKIGYAVTTFLICLFSIYLDYSKSDSINYVFAVGSGFGLIITFIDSFKNKEEY